MIRTVVVPALVAVLVTLLIEFFAKPYLEVRKERLLRAARRRWELVETSGRLSASSPEPSEEGTRLGQ